MRGRGSTLTRHSEAICVDLRARDKKKVFVAMNHVQGMVFVSEKLSHHWQALDDFEGAEYQRR